MRGERRLLRIGEYLIARACAHLPAGAREERYREWVAELPAILHDPGVRPAARRAARMLGYASGTIRGTALAPGTARRVLAPIARVAVTLIAGGVAVQALGLATTPEGWIACFLGALAVSVFGLAYRKKRGKDLGDELMGALEARARTRAQARAARVWQARAAAGFVTSAAGYTGTFPRRALGPGYRTAEVDDFIARIEATLSGHAWPGQAITPADVEAVKFRVTRHGGYDERTMDDVLDRYADELSKLTPFPSATAPGN
jgi:DivIVA domain-containing protein